MLEFLPLRTINQGLILACLAGPWIVLCSVLVKDRLIQLYIEDNPTPVGESPSHSAFFKETDSQKNNFSQF